MLSNLKVFNLFNEIVVGLSDSFIGSYAVSFESFNQNQLIIVMPELFLIFWITIVWCYLSINGQQAVALNSLRLSLIIVFALYFCTLLWQVVGNTDLVGVSNNLFVLYSKILIVVFALPILWLKNLDTNLSLYFGAIILFNLGLIGSADMLTTYVCLEGLSLLSYGVIATNKTTGSAEAGLKYFLYGIIASALLIFGLSLLYIQSKDLSWDLTYMWLAFNSSEYQIEIQVLSVLMIFSALIYKLSLFPFHFTLPDVYEGAEWHTIAVINVGVKLGVALFLFRLWGIFIISVELSEYLAIIISWFAVLSLIIGCLGAVLQTSLKRFFAYTSINQSGFIVMGLLTNSVFGLESALLYLLVYMISMLLFFYAISGKNISDDIAEVNKLTGLSRLSLIAALFSMAGIPPLFGFGSKYVVWLSLFDATSSGLLSEIHNRSIILLLIVSIVISLISAFYYLRLIKITSFKDVFSTSINILPAEVAVSINLILTLVGWPLFISVLFGDLNNYAILSYGLWVNVLF